MQRGFIDIEDKFFCSEGEVYHLRISKEDKLAYIREQVSFEILEDRKKLNNLITQAGYLLEELGYGLARKNSFINYERQTVTIGITL
jgi:hypothetical protein